MFEIWPVAFLGSEVVWWGAFGRKLHLGDGAWRFPTSASIGIYSLIAVVVGHCSHKVGMGKEVLRQRILEK